MILRALSTGSFLTRLSPSISYLPQPAALIHTSSCDCAARKYIRLKRMVENRNKARARALQRASQPQTKWIPPHLKIKLDPSNLKVGGRREQEESLLPTPSDDVFFLKGKKEPSYSLDEMLQFFRDSHDATMLNEPDSLLTARIDLDLRTSKKTKFLQPFSGTISDVPHKFGFTSKRSIVAICKDKGEAERARLAGAEYSGCQDIVRDLSKGNIKRGMYDEIVVSNDMLVAIANLRGILRDNFPSKSRGNYGPDVEKLVIKFKEGLFYEMKRDDFDPAYGFLNVPFARLNMDNKKIQDNLDAVLARVETYKPTTVSHDFIYKVLLQCDSDFPDAIERYPLKHWQMPSLASIYSDPNAEEEEEADDEKEAKASKKEKIGKVTPKSKGKSVEKDL